MTGLEPILAAAATAATTAAPYLAIGGSVLSAIGSIQGANAQADALERNAQVARVNAGSALAQSEAEAARQERDNRRRIATAVNAGAASGVDVASGSPLDLMADLAAEASLDEQITRWRGARQANASLTQGRQQLDQAGQTRTAGFMSAGTTLLTGFGRAARSFPTGPTVPRAPVGSNYAPGDF